MSKFSNLYAMAIMSAMASQFDKESYNKFEETRKSATGKQQKRQIIPKGCKEFYFTRSGTLVEKKL